MSTQASTQVGFRPPSTSNGMGWRVAVSIVSMFGLVSFVLLYFGFWASSFNFLQNIVVVLVAILVFIAANGAAWASWGIRRAARPPEESTHGSV